MSSIYQLLGDPIPFLREINNRLSAKGIDCMNYELDHLCYRVETLERYNELKKCLLTYSLLLVESDVNGRLIATFKLHEPLLFENRKIAVIELPSPKKGSFYKEGYEHVEFVITESFEDFIGQHSHLDFDTKGMNKSLNADIRLNLGDLNVKFHHLTLERVIEIENNLMLDI